MTQAVVRTIDLKGAPQGVAVTPTGSYAYVVTRSPDAVSIISTSNGGSRSVSVGFSPAVFGNFIGPNLITDVLEVSTEQALTGLGFGQFVDFQGGTLEAKASLTDARTLSLSTAGGTIDSNGFALTFSGDIIGAGALTKIGNGTLTVTGTNTYAGGTNINGGTLAVLNAAKLGSGPLSFDRGTLESLGAGNGITLNAAVTFKGEAIFLSDNGTTSTLSEVISGKGALTKDGPGTLIITGANTYSGGTNIDGGTVIVNSYSNLGTGPIRIHGGTLQVRNPSN